jgi:hypothetical protein
MTYGGVPFFYPWKKKSLNILSRDSLIRTGSMEESVYDILFILGYGAVIAVLFWKGKMVGAELPL